MAVSKPKRTTRNPVKRKGTYPNQKPLHQTDTNFVERCLGPGGRADIQTNGRMVVYPVLKRIEHPIFGENVWVDAIGDLDIAYIGDNLENVCIINVSECDICVRFKIV